MLLWVKVSFCTLFGPSNKFFRVSDVTLSIVLGGAGPFKKSILFTFSLFILLAEVYTRGVRFSLTEQSRSWHQARQGLDNTVSNTEYSKGGTTFKETHFYHCSPRDCHYYAMCLKDFSRGVIWLDRFKGYLKTKSVLVLHRNNTN